MRIGPVAGVVAILALGGSDATRVVAAEPIACEALARVPLAGGTILSAESVQAGGFTPPTPPNASAAGTFRTLPAFCRVTARLTPTPDSDIRVEVWLPRSGWNRKFQGVGNGGLGGAISYPALAAAVAAGYAAAGTDTGHVGGNGDFVPGHPEKLVDFAYRAIHEMTVSAEDPRRRALRYAPREVLLQLVLDGRKAGAHRSAALPGGFRRDRGRATRPGTRCGCTPPGSPERLHEPGTCSGHSPEQVSDDPRRRAERMRRLGRREGRCHRRPGSMLVRPGRVDVLGGRSRRLPDEAAGRVRESDGVADCRSTKRRRPASRSLLSGVGTWMGCRRKQYAN